MSKADKKTLAKKRRFILVVGVIILVLLSVGAYFRFVAPSMKKTTNTTSTTTKNAKTDAYILSLKQKDDQVTKLVDAGDQTSIQKATVIVDDQVTTAQKTGDDRQIVDAGVAKASFLIQTGRSQEALDAVLLPLDKKYATNETYKYDIYGCISWAYGELKDIAKRDEYYNKVPVRGWN